MDQDTKMEIIIRKIDSLIRHVDSLDRSMQKLAGRVTPYDNENLGKLVAREWKYEVGPKPTKLDAILAKVREADSHIEGIERDFSWVRSEIDSIEGGAVPREFIQPHIKPKR